MTVGVGELVRARKAMRVIGATGPELARPAADLPERVRSELGRFVDAGVVREGPAGTFFLHEGRAAAVLRAQILKTIVFWLVLVLVPVLLLQLSNSLPGQP